MQKIPHHFNIQIDIQITNNRNLIYLSCHVNIHILAIFFISIN